MKDYFNNKRVAIVGPSSSLIDKKLGKLIDSYDIVIRINRYEWLEKYKEDYGVKIDILYFNFWKAIPKINSNIQLIKACHHFNKFRNNLKIFKKSSISNKEIPHMLYDSKQGFKIQKNIGSWPSSGTFVMADLFKNLEYINELAIFAIDLCVNKYNKIYNKEANKTFKRYRNYDSKTGMLGSHNMRKELQYFKSNYNNLDISYKKKIKIYDENFLHFLRN